MIKIDVDLNAWERSLKTFLTKAKKDNYKVYHKVVEMFYDRVKYRTPVGNPTLWGFPAAKGYNPGTLRNSWETKWTGDIAEVKNDQPYAVRVEYGWSSQAPQGMMRLTFKELPQLIKKAMKGINNG